MAAPVGTGDGGHDAQPDAEGVAGRAVVRAGGVFAAPGGLGATLPGKLDADAPVAVGMGRLAIADDDGGQSAVDGRARVDVRPWLSELNGRQGMPARMAVIWLR